VVRSVVIIVDELSVGAMLEKNPCGFQVSFFGGEVQRSRSSPFSQIRVQPFLQEYLQHPRTVEVDCHMKYISTPQMNCKGAMYAIAEQQAENVLILAVQCHRQRIILEIGRADHTPGTTYQKEDHVLKIAGFNGLGQRCVTGAVHLPRVGAILKEHPHDLGRQIRHVQQAHTIPVNLISISSMAEQRFEHVWIVISRCQVGCGVTSHITRADMGGLVSKEQLGYFDVPVVGSMDQRRPVIFGTGIQVGTIFDAQLDGLCHAHLGGPEKCRTAFVLGIAGVQDWDGNLVEEATRSGEGRKLSRVLDGLGDDDDNLCGEIQERHFGR
jgi:hypothetical protein